MRIINLDSLKIQALILVSTLLVIAGCQKETLVVPEKESGSIVFQFNHLADGSNLKKDTTIYTNEAGNQYQINELMYFISDVVLYPKSGSPVLIDSVKDIHYVNMDIPSTLTWSIPDRIPAGEYDSIAFIFGISEEKNKSGIFVNPPESNMAWPTKMGGGYHYMMMNGKWIASDLSLKPFNFHMGIGQTYSGTTHSMDSITGFVQNYFRVSLPNSSFTISDKQTKTISLNMNIESWFKTPHAYDHNVFGGAIMKNQDAMNTIKENGMDVFSIGSIE